MDAAVGLPPADDGVCASAAWPFVQIRRALEEKAEVDWEIAPVPVVLNILERDQEFSWVG